MVTSEAVLDTNLPARRTRPFYRRLGWRAALCVCSFWVALAQTSEVLAQSSSGFGPSGSLETGDSVTEDIEQDDIDAGSAFQFPGAPLKPWFDAERRLNEQTGLKLNFSFQALYQKSDVSSGINEAAGGRGEVNGSWALFGRGTSNVGRLTFRIEDRTKYGTEIPPSQIGNQFGSGTLIGTGYSDYDSPNLSELAWRQSLANGRLRFVFGKISAVSWYGGHAFSSPKRGFQNSGLQGSNTRAFPGRGLGAGISYAFTPRLVGLAGIHDANAVTTENPFDRVDQSEFMKSAELRWYLTSPERARWDQARLHVWHQDARKEAGVSESYGANLVVSKLMFNDRVMPFLIAGVSEGDASLFNRDLSIGAGFGFNTTPAKARDVLGLGVSWGEPSNDAFQDQVSAEAYYRFQILDNIALTPSVQIINNPIANPSETTVTVLGLRFRATF